MNDALVIIQATFSLIVAYSIGLLTAYYFFKKRKKEKEGRKKELNAQLQETVAHLENLNREKDQKILELSSSISQLPLAEDQSVRSYVVERQGEISLLQTEVEMLKKELASSKIERQEQKSAEVTALQQDLMVLKDELFKLRVLSKRSQVVWDEPEDPDRENRGQLVLSHAESRMPAEPVGVGAHRMIGAEVFDVESPGPSYADDIETFDAPQSKMTDQELLSEPSSLIPRYIKDHLISHKDDGLTLSDELGKMIIYNHRLKDMTGYNKHDAESDGFMEKIYPDQDYRELIMRKISQIPEDHSFSKEHVSFCTSTGDMKILLVQSTSFRSNGLKYYLTTYSEQ